MSACRQNASKEYRLNKEEKCEGSKIKSLFLFKNELKTYQELHHQNKIRNKSIVYLSVLELHKSMIKIEMNIVI